MKIIREALTMTCRCGHVWGNEVEAMREAQRVSPEPVRCPPCLAWLFRWHEGKMYWAASGMTFSAR